MKASIYNDSNSYTKATQSQDVGWTGWLEETYLFLYLEQIKKLKKP